MLDVLTALVWDEPVDHYAATGMPVRTGNADPRGAPINVYPAVDGWVAVTLTTTEQWKQLVVLLGRPEWADELPTIRERAQHGAEIDDAFAAWSRRQPASAVERQLLEIGVLSAGLQAVTGRSAATTNSSRIGVSSSHCAIPMLRSRAGSSARGFRSSSTAGPSSFHRRRTWDQHRRGSRLVARPRCRRADPPARLRRHRRPRAGKLTVPRDRRVGVRLS